MLVCLESGLRVEGEEAALLAPAAAAAYCDRLERTGQGNMFFFSFPEEEMGKRGVRWVCVRDLQTLCN